MGKNCGRKVIAEQRRRRSLSLLRISRSTRDSSAMCFVIVAAGMCATGCPFSPRITFLIYNEPRSQPFSHLHADATASVIARGVLIRRPTPQTSGLRLPNPSSFIAHEFILSFLFYFFFPLFLFFFFFFFFLFFFFSFFASRKNTHVLGRNRPGGDNFYWHVLTLPVGQNETAVLRAEAKAPAIIARHPGGISFLRRTGFRIGWSSRAFDLAA